MPVEKLFGGISYLKLTQKMIENQPHERTMNSISQGYKTGGGCRWISKN
jgi:hypothetical protein